MCPPCLGQVRQNPGQLGWERRGRGAQREAPDCKPRSGSGRGRSTPSWPKVLLDSPASSIHLVCFLLLSPVTVRHLAHLLRTHSCLPFSYVHLHPFSYVTPSDVAANNVIMTECMMYYLICLFMVLVKKALPLTIAFYFANPNFGNICFLAQ